MYFIEHLMGTFGKSPWENNLNNESLSLLIRWLKSYTDISLQRSTSNMRKFRIKTSHNTWATRKPHTTETQEQIRRQLSHRAGTTKGPRLRSWAADRSRLCAGAKTWCHWKTERGKSFWAVTGPGHSAAHGKAYEPNGQSKQQRKWPAFIRCEEWWPRRSQNTSNARMKTRGTNKAERESLLELRARVLTRRKINQRKWRAVRRTWLPPGARAGKTGSCKPSQHSDRKSSSGPNGQRKCLGGPWPWSRLPSERTKNSPGLVKSAQCWELHWTERKTRQETKNGDLNRIPEKRDGARSAFAWRKTCVVTRCHSWMRSPKWRPRCTGKSQPESARDEENTAREWTLVEAREKQPSTGGSQMKNEEPANWNKQVCKNSISTARRTADNSRK
jgi:hypothetical protein